MPETWVVPPRVLADAVDLRDVVRLRQVNALLADKASVGHQHSVSDLAATGDRTATSFLRGDGAWAVPVAGPVSPVDVGNLTGAVTLDAAVGPGQRGVLVGDVTLNPPSSPAAGRVLVLTGTATGASRLITIATAIGRMAGYPSTLQVSVGRGYRIVMQYDGPLGRWMLLAHTVEQ